MSRDAVALQRGMIRVRRGEVDGALAALEFAAEPHAPLLGRATTRAQRTYSRGLRAFLRASRGDAEGARADMSAVRADPEAAGESLALASLAEAVVLERSGDRAALRAHLVADGGLLLEGTTPRERAIVRAYQRMLKTSATSVYRESARRDAETSSEEPSMADWVAKLVPSAAPFVPAPRPAKPSAALPDEAPAPTANAQRAIVAARKAAAKGSAFKMTRLLLVWIVLVAGAFAVWQLLGDAGAERGVPVRAPVGAPFFAWFAGFAAIFMVMFVGLVVNNFVRASRANRRFAEARRLFARGELDEAAKLVRPASKSRLHLTAAQAHLFLAGIADRRADFAEVLAECDRGLGHLDQKSLRDLAADQLHPELIAERAFALAVLGRDDEATAELASLAPPYPLLDRARLRVRLVQLARAGDLARAAGLVDATSPDALVSRRDELLADAIRAAHAPERVGAGEVARLKEELRTWSEGRRWLETVAPAARGAHERTAHEPPAGAGGGTAEAARDELAEEEHAAGLEALALDAASARTRA